MPMDFSFDLASCLGVQQDQDGPCVGVVDERMLRGPGGANLAFMLKELGQKSAVAQGLRKPVTYGSGLGDHRVYVLVDGRQALGFLKVGSKRLFMASQQTSDFADVKGAFKEIEPLCALDFYVDDGRQRCGYGRQIFEAMLQTERTLPARMGYDRPSPKLMAFLKRHYGLWNFRPQSNNFVVFQDYFGQSRGNEADVRSARGNAKGGEAAPRRFEPQRASAQFPGNASERDRERVGGGSPNPLAASCGFTAGAGGVERRGVGNLAAGRGLGPVRDLFGDVGDTSPTQIRRHVGTVGSR